MSDTTVTNPKTRFIAPALAIWLFGPTSINTNISIPTETVTLHSDSPGARTAGGSSDKHLASA